MERKVGEVFTYKGKTYKILKATYGCRGCAFYKQTCVGINKIEKCFTIYRKDKTSVIFKEINNMKERNITITLDKAKEWFNSENATLKEIALQAFNKDELTFNFKRITTFKKACDALGLNSDDMFSIIKNIATISKASAAMFKLNIIRKALNLGQDLHLTKNPENSYIYYPYNPFITKSSNHYKSEIDSGRMEIIGKIKNEGEEYNVLGGSTAPGVNIGLGCFTFYDNVGFADNSIGFLGCANKEIAQHLGKYFGMLITEAKYGDMVDFEIISGY